MKYIIILIGGLILFSCSFTREVKRDNDMILGRWCCVSTMADYPHLTFRQGGYVIFDCKIDTVFGMKYTLDKSNLLLKSTNQPAISEKILKLTKDSLVLETLLDHKTKQEYYRCK